MTFRIGSLCSGYDGLAMGIQAVLSGNLAFVADNDDGPAKILAHRYPSVPNLGDITTIDWREAGRVDLLCMGFPCTDVSCAGARIGLRAGTRSGVWAYCAQAIGELRPSLVVIENVRGLLSAGADSNVELCPWCMGEADPEHSLRAAGAVLGDLAGLGYDAQWVTVSASDAGAPHQRKRVFFLAWPAANTVSIPVQRWGEPGLLGGAQSAAAGVLVEREIPERQRQRDGHATADRDQAATEDPDSPAGRERWLPASGQAPGGRPRPDASGSGGARIDDDEPPGFIEWCPDDPSRWHNSWGYCTSGSPPADATGRRREGRGGSSTPRPPALRGEAVHENGHSDRPVAWGTYEPAIRRWESILGRRAPRPTEPGRTGERLSPRFVEWMMGLPEGWVTDVPGLTRNAQLKALGNGCVPQQVALALSLLLERVPAQALAFLDGVNAA